MNRNRLGSKSSFTLTEVLVAFSIATLVIAGVMTTFIWCGQQAALSSRIAWSQNEAMTTASKLTTYIRNASEVVSIDTNFGTWVELRFPDDSTARLVYSNAVPELRDGRMYIQRANGTQNIVARGLTEIQSSDGFYTPDLMPGFMFSMVRRNALRVAYRVSEPLASGGRAANDGPYANAVRFMVCLRNAEE